MSEEPKNNDATIGLIFAIFALVCLLAATPMLGWVVAIVEWVLKLVVWSIVEWLVLAGVLSLAGYFLWNRNRNKQ